MRRSAYSRFFWSYVGVLVAISFFGIVFLYSATVNLDGAEHAVAVKQCLRIAIGLVVFFVVSSIGYKAFLNVSYLLYGAALVLLVMVLLFGSQRYGAQRWLYIGPIGFQPSEFAKLAVLLALSHYLGKRKRNLYQTKRFIVAFLLTVIPLVMVLKQPDLGTSLIFLPILFCMLYVWGARLRYFLLTFTMGLASMPFLWFLLKPYQRDRLLAFIDPNKDPLGASYTVIQSQIGIGSGGLLGKGWLSGTQNKLHFIPEHHTDFIFSVVGEEGGFVAVIVFFLLFMLLLRLSFQVIRTTTDMSGRLLAAGIISMVFFHFFINIGMTIGMMPVTGLPLPLVSYGGSSIVSFFIAFGLLVSIYKERSIF